MCLESWLEPPATLQTCHRDLWADNVLPTAQGGVCVIDWENSGPADPDQELACVLFEFGRSDPGRARALMSAYSAAGGPAAVSRPGHFSMLIAQLGHIAQIAATDWLEPNVRNPDRAGAAAWIGEILNDPHTRDVLGALLDVVCDTTGPKPSRAHSWQDTDRPAPSGGCNRRHRLLMIEAMRELKHAVVESHRARASLRYARLSSSRRGAPAKAAP